MDIKISVWYFYFGITRKGTQGEIYMEKDLHGRTWMSHEELDRKVTWARALPYIFVGGLVLFVTVIIAYNYYFLHETRRWVTIVYDIVICCLFSIFLWRGLQKRAKRIAAIIEDIKTNSRSITITQYKIKGPRLW
jgi:hypothetical protein